MVDFSPNIRQYCHAIVLEVVRLRFDFLDHQKPNYSDPKLTAFIVAPTDNQCVIADGAQFNVRIGIVARTRLEKTAVHNK